MDFNASLLLLVTLLIDVSICSADNFLPLKWKDSKNLYTININFIPDTGTLRIAHDKGLVVVKLASFPKQNISQTLRKNDLELRGIIIENCTLPDGDSFGILFKHLGIESEIFSFSGINISEQGSSLDGRFSSGFEKVKILTLNKNTIKTLSESVFESLAKLTVLNLMQNGITEVNENVFKNLTKLKTLHMKFNELKSLSEGMFDNQKELQFLNLENNTLKNLTKDMFRGLSSLEYLWLNENAVSLMDDVFHHLPKINHISMGSGVIEVKYDISVNHNQLKSLSLTHVNLLEGLQFSGLKELQLASSKVMNISGLSNIDIVSIKNCEINSVNVNSFKSLNSTRELSLSSNNISILVDGLFNGLTKLVSLNLSNNQLTEISELVLGKLHNLKYIDFSYNNLTTIHPNAFDNNTQLTTIHLENNRLSFRDDKTPFMRASNLEILDLSGNNLTRIPDLVALTKLKTLNLTNNTISSFNFSEIRQYSIILNARYEPPHTLVDMNTRIYLDGNSLECDCGMFNFLSGTNQKQLAQLAPAFSHRCFRNESEPCHPKPITTHCPVPYSCEEIVNESYSQIVISYKGKNLAKLPDIPFMNATSIKLDISNNSLVELPLMDRKLNVTFIQASSNQISVIEMGKLPPTLRGLDLSQNQFRTIAPDVLLQVKNLKNLEVFFFKNNPLKCHCSSEDSKELIKFIDVKSSMTDLQGVKCNQDFELTTRALESFCENESKNELIVRSLAGVTIVTLLFVVILLSFIKHHKFIKMWLYAHGWFLWWVDEEYVDREKVYDVFISYEHSNRLLAFRIMYALEKCNVFKVCLHERDFPGGGRIEESVNSAVRNSRRTLVILSENYLNSVWCEHEFHLAWNRCVAEKRKLIIAVKDGNLGDVADETIRSYIETHTYIESGDEWFFERLIFRLPHKRTIKNIFPIREWEVIPLETDESSF